MIEHSKASVKADQNFDTYGTACNRIPDLYKIKWSVDTQIFRHTGRTMRKVWVSARLTFLGSIASPVAENQPSSVQTWTPSLGNTEEAARQTVVFIPELGSVLFFFFPSSSVFRLPGKKLCHTFTLLESFQNVFSSKGANPAYKKPLLPHPPSPPQKTNQE